jgi:hypothetical protein
MSPSKKSSKLVSPKAQKGKKGAASVFPKGKGGKTWSELPDGVLPDSERKKRRPAKPTISAAAKQGLKRLSQEAFGPAAPKPAAKRARGTTPPSKTGGAPAPPRPGPPPREWQFLPPGLYPERPVPVEVNGRLWCPCCVRESGRPFYFVNREDKYEKKGAGGKLSGVMSAGYDERSWNKHLAKNHGFPPSSSSTKKRNGNRSFQKKGVGQGGNPYNPGGRIGERDSTKRPTVFVWVWNYGQGWELEEIREDSRKRS